MNSVPNITLVSGAARSGKSNFAENLLKNYTNVNYLATFKSNLGDKNWLERIKRHKDRRPKSWLIIENYDDINFVFKNINNDLPIIIDSVGGIVYNELTTVLDDWNRLKVNLIDNLVNYPSELILVVEEASWGITPTDQMSNLFRDRLGEFTQELEAIADDSYLIVHGLPIDLKKLSL